MSNGITTRRPDLEGWLAMEHGEFEIYSYREDGKNWIAIEGCGRVSVDWDGKGEYFDCEGLAADALYQSVKGTEPLDMG